TSSRFRRQQRRVSSTSGARARTKSDLSSLSTAISERLRKTERKFSGNFTRVSRFRDGNRERFSIPIGHASVKAKRGKLIVAQKDGALHAPEFTRCTRSGDEFNCDKTDEKGNDFRMWTKVAKTRPSYNYR